MNENEINNFPSESNSMSTDGMNHPMSDNSVESAPPSSDDHEGNESKEGLSFNWLNLVIGVAICIWWSEGGNVFSENWTSYLFLCVVVVIHELGHVIAGKSFGCYIKEMQVFFLSFVSYKPKRTPEGSSWRDIKWSLGVLPLGGVTVFKSRGADSGDNVGDLSSTSPYIEDKPAWQRLLISAAGVLFNIASFLILYFVLPHISDEWYEFLWPLTALSLILAVLNILPIYPLDGGAIVFALFEIITGKKPSPGFTTACGWIGFIIIVLFFWVFPEWLDGILESVFRSLF